MDFGVGEALTRQGGHGGTRREPTVQLRSWGSSSHAPGRGEAREPPTGAHGVATDFGDDTSLTKQGAHGDPRRGSRSARHPPGRVPTGANDGGPRCSYGFWSRQATHQARCPRRLTTGAHGAATDVGVGKQLARQGCHWGQRRGPTVQLRILESVSIHQAKDSRGPTTRGPRCSYGFWSRRATYPFRTSI